MERVVQHNDGELTAREAQSDGVLLTICKAPLERKA
jgi:hypothetical protein